MKAPKNIIIAVVATLIIAGGGGFYGGMTYEKSRGPASFGPNGQFAGAGVRTNTNIPGAAAGARLRGGTGFVNGSILSLDDKSITVKNRAGGSQIIFFSPGTAIGKTTSGTLADLKVGENIMVNGTPNSDGTVTATNIQISPADSTVFGGPGGAIPINVNVPKN